MMNKTLQMISLDEDTYQYIQNYIIEQKMSYLGHAIADICNRFRYEQWIERILTIITETVSIELKNDVKKALKKITTWR
ncbi:hypothetical protein Q5794_31130 (plasmid) [Priestia megaterium]|uniref:hypothetical protein n=1 Tax=Priestia megaterium TaxID=1404 RepID=UPI0035BE65A3